MGGLTIKGGVLARAELANSTETNLTKAVFDHCGPIVDYSYRNQMNAGFTSIRNGLTNVETTLTCDYYSGVPAGSTTMGRCPVGIPAWTQTLQQTGPASIDGFPVPWDSLRNPSWGVLDSVESAISPVCSGLQTASGLGLDIPLAGRIGVSDIWPGLGRASSGCASARTSIADAKVKMHAVAMQGKAFLFMANNMSTEIFDNKLRPTCQRLLRVLGGPWGRANGGEKALIEGMVSKLKLVGATVIGLKYGLTGFQILIAPAIAVAPGMMKGALAIKMLVPQSSLPGAFIVMLPWLYCPIMWCIYNLFVQVVIGHLGLVAAASVLIAFLCIAFAPMCNVIIGELKSIHGPMNDNEVLRVTSLIDRCVLMMVICAGFMAGIFYYSIKDVPVVQETDKKGIAKEALQELSESPLLRTIINVIKILVGVLSKKFLTTLAATDYMLGMIVEDRRFEKMLMELKRPPEPAGCCGRKSHVDVDTLEAEPIPDTPKKDTEAEPTRGTSFLSCLQKKEDASVEELEVLSDKEQLQAVYKDRTTRLDDLCHLMYVDEDKEYMERKNVGMAAARKMRSEAYKNAISRVTEQLPVGFVTVRIHSGADLMRVSQAPKDPASQPEQPALPAAVTMETPNAYCVLEALQHNPVTGQSQVSKDYLVPPLRTVDQLACVGAERS